VTTLPILWTFRRCPYAMRARLAIQSSGRQVVLQEILLKDKPTAFLAASPKGTVPVVQDGDDVIEESRDVMLWALGRSDPENWLKMPAEGHTLIDTCDGPFKRALDHTKYAVRFPDRDEAAERA
jgi:glutathione S-transferase